MARRYYGVVREEVAAYNAQPRAAIKIALEIQKRVGAHKIRDWRDNEAVRSGVGAWYRQRAEDVFARSIERCSTIADRHGAACPAMTIRKMRTRWGSCSTKGRLMLNLYLVQAPVHCIDYVVMHELCHTVEHNHSKAFYRLMTRCMPDWEKRKAALKSVFGEPAVSRGLWGHCSTLDKVKSPMDPISIG